MQDDGNDSRTYAIIGAAFNVHKAFGSGYLEGVYHDALTIEFEALGIPFHREFPISLSHRGRALGTPYRADFLCGDVIVELKAISQLGQVEERQVVHYLRATARPVGLLLNFGSSSLQVRRLENTRPKASPQSSESLQSPIRGALDGAPPMA